MPNTHLQQKAMLVTLRLSSWYGRKTDREATADILERNNATKDRAKVIKRLISESRLRPIHAITSELRQIHYKLTMPWDDGGRRLLPVKVLERYRAEIAKLFEAREKSVSRLVKDYNATLEEAQTELGKLFYADEYPTADQIGRAFTHEYEIAPIPDGTHFVANIGEAEAERLRESIEKTIKRRTTEAATSLWERLSEAVTLVAARLSKPEGDQKRFHASLLDTLRELSAVIPTLDINDDPKLRSVCAQVQTAINGIDPDMLRPKSKAYNAETRRRVGAHMDDIKDQMGGYFDGAAS